MKSKTWELSLEVTWEEIYKALQERDMNNSVANVKLLCKYLEATARDAISTALVDFVQNKVGLREERTEELARQAERELRIQQTFPSEFSSEEAYEEWKKAND